MRRGVHAIGRARLGGGACVLPKPDRAGLSRGILGWATSHRRHLGGRSTRVTGTFTGTFVASRHADGLLSGVCAVRPHSLTVGMAERDHRDRKPRACPRVARGGVAWAGPCPMLREGRPDASDGGVGSCRDAFDVSPAEPGLASQSRHIEAPASSGRISRVNSTGSGRAGLARFQSFTARVRRDSDSRRRCGALGGGHAGHSCSRLPAAGCRSAPQASHACEAR